jgi:hypothetical protein
VSGPGIFNTSASFLLEAGTVEVAHPVGPPVTGDGSLRRRVYFVEPEELDHNWERWPCGEDLLACGVLLGALSVPLLLVLGGSRQREVVLVRDKTDEPEYPSTPTRGGGGEVHGH